MQSPHEQKEATHADGDEKEQDHQGIADQEEPGASGQVRSTNRAAWNKGLKPQFERRQEEPGCRGYQCITGQFMNFRVQLSKSQFNSAPSANLWMVFACCFWSCFLGHESEHPL